MATRVLIDEIAVTQIKELTSEIKEIRSSVSDENKREAKACVDELIGKIDLAFALAEPYVEEEAESDGE